MLQIQSETGKSPAEALVQLTPTLFQHQPECPGLAQINGSTFGLC